MYQNPGRKEHYTMRGAKFDMEKRRNENANTVAMGNARMNARGDIVQPNGQVLIRREQIVQDYYKNNPQGVKHVSLKDTLPDTFETPSQAVERLLGQVNTPQVSQSAVDEPSDVMGKNKARRLLDKED